MRACLLALLAALASATAQASPNVPLDDPAYVELGRLRALGMLGTYQGGLRPLTEAQIQDTFERAGVDHDPYLVAARRRGFWLLPLRRAALELDLVDETPRAYTTDLRRAETLTMEGAVAASCEYREGRPCGRGAGLIGDIDVAAGWSRFISAYVRLRIITGSESYSPIGSWDRAYVNAEWGPLAFEIGRDTLALGPSARAQALWSTNAPPIDHVRISALRFRLPKVPGRILRLSVFYMLGRLRDPQRFEGTLVDIIRGQFDLFDNVEIGISNLLQFGGKGAFQLGFTDWLSEHFTRKSEAAGADSSNRRVSLDVSFMVRRLRGLRMYYEVAFEDWRKAFGDALAYDADHVAGAEWSALTTEGKHGFLFEYQHIGARSQTHYVWTSGLTNAGQAVGTPLGPDTWSLFAAARLDLKHAHLIPSVEFIRGSSDSYDFISFGPINRTGNGVVETRYRLSVGGDVAVTSQLRVTWRTMFEHVTAFDYTVGQSKENVVLQIAANWTPWRL